MIDAPTAWPDKFIYVCNATKANVVNFAPLIHAGLERVDRVVVFRGFEGSGEDPADRAYAIDTAEALRKTVQLACRREDIIVEIDIGNYDGDGEKAHIWSRHIARVIEKYRETPIVYCMTGGRKPMMLGTMYKNDNELIVVHVHDKTLRSQFLRGLDFVDAPQNGQFSIDDFLMLNGYYEANKGERENIEQFYRTNARTIKTFAQIFMQTPTLATVLNGVTQNLTPSKNFFPSNIHLINQNRPAVASWVSRLLSVVSGFGVSPKGNNTWRVTTVEAARFLKGGWLEGFLFNEVSRLANKRNDVQVATHVDCHIDGSSAFELDVAILIGGQLHVLEAKTGRLHDETDGQHLRQCEEIKSALSGQPGKLIVVNPGIGEAAMEERNFEARAQQRGIEYRLGAGAIEAALEDIKATLDRHRPYRG